MKWRDKVGASNGIQVDCDLAVGDDRDLGYAFVVAGDDQARTLTRRIRQWLLRIDRSKTVLGAVDSGAFLLAEARVMRRRAITVHPGAASAFREQYPQIELSSEPVVRDGSLLTCAGGLSIVSLMLSLIQEHCGPVVARSVAEDLVLTGCGARDKPIARAFNPTSGAARMNEVVALMESAVEDPLSLQALSSRVGLSRRQVTRQFLRELGRPPMEYYRALRLDRAKQLLSQSELTVSEIATAVGFQSLSAFSRGFCAQFGCSPRQLRTNLRKEGNAASVPAGNRHKRLRFRANRR